MNRRPPPIPLPSRERQQAKAETRYSLFDDAAAPVMPRVLNKRKHGVPAGAIYCGRPGKWGNPFEIGVDGNRDEVCDKFEAWFETSHLRFEIHELRGKDLVCWCAPLRCHCNYLLRRANTPLTVANE